MKYELEIEERVLQFLNDLYLADSHLYRRVCAEIDALEQEPEGRGSEVIIFDFLESKMPKFQIRQLRKVEVGSIRINYTIVEKPAVVRITMIYDSQDIQEAVRRYLG